jgi:hypothetical protein
VGEPQRHGHPGRRPGAQHRPADHAVQQHRHRADRSWPVLGRDPGQRDDPQVHGQRPVVRPGQW